MKNNRDQIIIRTSIIGIIANVFLAAFKAAIGLLSHSVAVVMDAVNNLSDALSSLITIIGTKLSQKAPDKKHPMGYGRIEYLSAVIISVIVLYAGITSLVESVKKIIEPQVPDYSPVSLIIIGAAVAVKLILGRYVKKTGESVKSDALIASGSDASFDAIISASTLAAAVLYLTLKVRLEAWLGAVISLIIVKSGVEMLRDTISEILGERVDAELAKAVKSAVVSFPEVGGAYDLFIDNYGPEQVIGSIHIELPDTMTMDQADALQRQIARKVAQETGVIMTGISVYSMNTRNDKAAKMLAGIREIISEYPEILQIHGFYLEEEIRTIRFDMVVSFDVKDRVRLCDEIKERIQQQYPGYEVHPTLDYDISD